MQPITSALTSALASLKLHSIASVVDVDAQPSGLSIRSKDANYHLTRRDDWPPVLSAWSEQVRGDVRRAALDRLVRYFERNVPGGF